MQRAREGFVQCVSSYHVVWSQISTQSAAHTVFVVICQEYVDRAKIAVDVLTLIFITYGWLKPKQNRFGIKSV